MHIHQARALFIMIQKYPYKSPRFIPDLLPRNTLLGPPSTLEAFIL